MIATDTGVRLNVGLPGHGKTFTNRRELLSAARSHPVIVLDLTWEWRREPYNRIPADVGPAYYTTTVAKAASLIDRDARIVIVNPNDAEAEAEAACRWALARQGQAGVAVSEAHLAWPVNKPLSSNALRCIMAHRHFGVSMWVDTQRFALLNRNFDAAQVIRIFSVAASEADRARLRDLGGRALEEAVARCAQRNAKREHGGAGEPGWHVVLYEGVRGPDFTPTRE